MSPAVALVAPDASDSALADGEAAEGSDSKPPHQITNAKSSRRSSTSSRHHDPFTADGPHRNGRAAPGFEANGATAIAGSSSLFPLPPHDALSYPKQPGLTRGELEKITRMPSGKSDGGKSATSVSSMSPTPSISESDYSLPSTRPPSQPVSRHNSTNGPRPQLTKLFSGGKSSKVPKEKDLGSPAAEHQTPTTPKSKGPPSIRSEGGGHKFQLKDLLGTAPKISRRSSQRSTGSSRKSDSDGKSNAGDSTGSLLKKYGVCGKVAIGKGATSVVRLVHKWDRSEEKLYAVKEFRKRRKNETEKEYVKKLTAEFCISSTLHHVNIVETVDLVQDEAAHWCEVMEFCPGGDLYAAIKKGGMSPSEVECCFKQILTGISYLHGQGVAHRDIKPENVFFDIHGHVKIGDYGASTVYRLPWEKTVHMSTGLCGSEPYIAPEQFLHKPYDARLVDIWACGIVYYCLHFQELPWRVAQPSDPLYAAYVAATQSTNAEKAACPKVIDNLSPRACRPLIRKMLEPDPKHRYTIEEIIKHPWIESVEVCYLSAKPSHIHVNARAMAQAQLSGPHS